MFLTYRALALIVNVTQNYIVPWLPISLTQMLFTVILAKVGVSNGVILIIILLI